MIAMYDLAPDKVFIAQKFVALFYITSSDLFTDIGRTDIPVILLQFFHDLQGKTISLGKFLQHLGIAPSHPAKGKVGAAD